MSALDNYLSALRKAGGGRIADRYEQKMNRIRENAPSFSKTSNKSVSSATGSGSTGVSHGKTQSNSNNKTSSASSNKNNVSNVNKDDGLTKEQIQNNLNRTTTNLGSNNVKLPGDQGFVPRGVAFNPPDNIIPPPEPTSTDRVGMTATPDEIRSTNLIESKRTGEPFNIVRNRNINNNLNKFGMGKTKPNKTRTGMSPSEYYQYLYNRKMGEDGLQENYQKAYDFKQGWKRGGTEYEKTIGFNYKDPVFYDGRNVPGNELIYTVENFQPVFADGTGLKAKKSSSIDMTSLQYDIYLENMARYYNKQAQNINLKEYEDMMAAINQEMNRTSDYHPDTRIRKIDTEEGTRFEYDFPFKGADVYYSTSKNIDKANPLQKFAMALTPENFAGVPATIEYLLGNPDKAREIEVSAIGGTRNQDPLDFIGWYAGSPMGTIGLTALTYGTSNLIAPTIGRVATKYPVASALAGKVAQRGVQGYILYSGGKDLVENISEGEIGRGFGNVFRLGTQYYGMSRAAKAGMTSIDPKTGLPKFRVGAQKGYNQYLDRMLKKGFITNTQATNLRGLAAKNYDLYKYMAKNNFKPKQPEPVWSPQNIENINNQRFLRGFRNLWTRGRSKLLGGMVSNKPSTKDIDIQFSPLRKAQYNAIMKNLGYSLDDGVDWHFLQKPGDMATTMGSRVQPGYGYASGGQGIRWYEQFTRLGDSSLNLAHAGRAKDIKESVRMLKMMFPKGLPKSLGFTIADYEKAALAVYRDPLVMSPFASNIYYGSGFSDKIKEAESKIYEKVFGRYFKSQANELKTLIDAKPQSWGFNTSYTPPSPTFNPSSILSPIEISAAINPSANIYPMNFVRMYRPSPRFGTTSTSFTYPGYKSPSINRSRSPSSRSVSQPGSVSSILSSMFSSMASPSSSRRPSISKSPSRSPSSSRSSSRSPSSSRSSSRSPSSSRSSSRSPSSSSSSSRSSSSSSSSSVFSPPPPPFFPWFPPMGGKFGSKGKQKPFDADYYNEYAALQKLMKEVIL